MCSNLAKLSVAAVHSVSLEEEIVLESVHSEVCTSRRVAFLPCLANLAS